MGEKLNLPVFCGLCKFWIPLSEEEIQEDPDHDLLEGQNWGRCHRFPPFVNPLGRDMQSFDFNQQGRYITPWAEKAQCRFPLTSGDEDFCGEFIRDGGIDG